jgi:hypothetical protein
MKKESSKQKRKYEKPLKIKGGFNEVLKVSGRREKPEEKKK